VLFILAPALIFTADLIYPIGMAAGLAYLVILFLASRKFGSKEMLALSSLISLFLLLQPLLTTSFSETFSFTNRFLGVAFLWFFTYLLTKSRKHETAVRLSEHRYRSVVESTNEGIIIINRKGKVEFQNNRIFEIFGFTKEEMNKNILSGYVFEDLKQLLEKKRRVESEMVFTKKDNKSFQAAVQLIPIQDGVPDELYLIIIRDLTSRKKAETALKESQDRLSGIVASAMDAIISINSEQKIILFNKAAEFMFGYSQNEVLGKQLDLLIPGGSRTSHKQHVKKFGETGTTSRRMGALGTVRGLKKDGADFPIEASISQVETENDKFYTVILRDITERKIYEQRILESEDRFRNMADNAPVLIWITDEKNNFTYFNKTWLIFTGRLFSDEIDDGWMENLHQDEKEEVVNSFRTAFENKEPFVNEFRLKRNDGSFRWLINHGQPRFTPERQFAGYIGSCIDITERKNSEESLNSSLKEKEVLLKEVHHRVKNNLQIVSSLLNLQSEHIKDEKMIELILESQNRIKSMALIHEKLYQTKALSRIDLNIYLSELVDNIMASYSNNPQVVTLDLNIENIEIDIDAGIDLGLIINELVTNSMKYAFPNGFDKEKRIAVTVSRDNIINKYKLVVADNGIGIPKGFDISTSESLGLQLVETLVTQMDGTINISSNQGTTTEIIF
jgi:PAS domain S-box-containing protein